MLWIIISVLVRSFQDLGVPAAVAGGQGQGGQRVRQDGVGRADLVLAQLAERHLLQVQLKLHHCFAHLLHVEHESDEVFDLALERGRGLDRHWPVNLLWKNHIKKNHEH